MTLYSQIYLPSFGKGISTCYPFSIKKGKYNIPNDITIERKILLQMIQGVKWQYIICNIILEFENLLPAKSQISLTGKG